MVIEIGYDPYEFDGITNEINIEQPAMEGENHLESNVVIEAGSEWYGFTALAGKEDQLRVSQKSTDAGHEIQLGFWSEVDNPLFHRGWLRLAYDRTNDTWSMTGKYIDKNGATQDYACCDPGQVLDLAIQSLEIFFALPENTSNRTLFNSATTDLQQAEHRAQIAGSAALYTGTGCVEPPATPAVKEDSCLFAPLNGL